MDRQDVRDDSVPALLKQLIAAVGAQNATLALLAAKQDKTNAKLDDLVSGLTPFNRAQEK